jgi:hypothetical protein
MYAWDLDMKISSFAAALFLHFLCIKLLSRYKIYGKTKNMHAKRNMDIRLPITYFEMGEISSQTTIVGIKILVDGKFF